MCELLGMNSHKPASISFSFEGFVRRGGETGEHRDGWGIAFFEDKGCRLLIDDLPSVQSPLADIIRRSPIKSRNVIAHVRKATQGTVALQNCHPFMRELWGQYWIFAHNGDLKQFNPEFNGPYHPVGNTDSERAFCYLLQGLRARFGDTQPALDELVVALRELTATIAGTGIFNYMLSNGAVLFAHCSTNLHFVSRQYPFARAKLIDCDASIDFSAHNHLDDQITVLATHPLTADETWHAFLPGEFKVFVDGREANFTMHCALSNTNAVGANARELAS